MSDSHEAVSASRSPIRKPGSDARNDDPVDELGAPDPEGPGRLDEARVDAANGAEGVDVDRHRHRERDQRDLGDLADAEPHDQQRHKGEVRNRAQHFHVRVDEVLAHPRQPRRQSQYQTQRDPERRPVSDPQQAGEQVLLQRPVGDQVGRGLDDSARRRHRPGVEDSSAGEDLPQRDEQHRAEQALHRARDELPALPLARQRTRVDEGGARWDPSLRPRAGEHGRHVRRARRTRLRATRTRGRPGPPGRHRPA